MIRCALLLLLLAIPARTQAQRPRVPERAIKEELSVEDSTFAARLRLARSFMGAAQIARAIVVLEDLHAERAEDTMVFESLVGAYEAVKQYDDAQDLLDRALGRSDTDAAPGLLAEKARLFYLSGAEQQALAAWNRILDGANGKERIYRLVYESMMRVRLIDKAIAALERGRADTGRKQLFQTELAYLHSVIGAHDLAMEEYLDLLSTNARQINYVRGRLSQTLQQEGALDASLPVVQARILREPNNRSYRELYAWLLMEQGDFQQAFEQHRILSRGEEHAGRILFDFASRAADLGAFEIAAAAFDEVLSSHPEDPIAAEAQLGVANMHRQHAAQRAENDGFHHGVPHYEAAVAAYQTFLVRFPGHAEYPEVLRKIGDLQHNVFFQHDAARETLTAVALHYPGSAAAQQARFDLGQLEVDYGQLETARIVFEQLESDLGHQGTLAEHARHERALIAFYQGNLAEASRLSGTVRQHTASDVANDALALRVLLLENPGPDSANAALQQLGTARFLLRQRKAQQAIDAAESLLQTWGQHPVADDARFLRARALREAGQTKEALAAFGELPLIHSNSPLADHALFFFATMLEREMNRTDAALRAYGQLLSQFPGSILAPRVRARIRFLRTAEGQPS